MFTPVRNIENQKNKPTKTNGTFFGGTGGTPFFQAKLTVNQPDDRYEQEADAVAEQVVQMKEGDMTIHNQNHLTPISVENVQREEENEKQSITPQTTIPNWIGQGYFLRTGQLPFSLSTPPRPRLLPGLKQPLLTGFSPTSPLLLSPPPAWILSMKPWTQYLPTPDDGLDWAAVNQELATRGALHLRDGLHDSVVAQYQANFLFFKNLGFSQEQAMKWANSTLPSAVGKSVAREYPSQSEMFESTLSKDDFKIPPLPLATATFGGPPGNRGSLSLLGGLKKWVFRKEIPGTDNSVTAPKVVEDTLANDSGQSMDTQTQTFMEGRFGQDFGQVRIHTGAKAAESASAIQAKAYTSGKDIVFGGGEYRPESSEGKRLLAHELVHVGQQKGVKPSMNIQLTSEENISEEIPNSHILYEYIAHHIVYEKKDYMNGGNSKATYNTFQKVLWIAGFNPNPKESIWLGSSTGEEGDACIIFPRNDIYKKQFGGKNEIVPILAFRGTEIDNLHTDTDWIQVGHNLYNKHEKRINQLLDLVERVDIVGHSLGGAMAQIAAARNPGKVRKLVTFQSPGISKVEVDKFRKSPMKERPEVFHHIVNNDVVDLAGEENIPGTFYLHHLADYLDQGSAHTAFVFGTDSFKDRRTNSFGLSDPFLKGKLGKTVYGGNPEISKFDKYPFQKKREMAEIVRKIIGQNVKKDLYIMKKIIDFLDYLGNWNPPGGINLVTPDGGAMPEQRKAKVDVETINIEVLLEVLGALGKGANSLIGKPSLGNEFADKLNDIVEMYKKSTELAKNKDNKLVNNPLSQDIKPPPKEDAFDENLSANLELKINDAVPKAEKTTSEEPNHAAKNNSDINYKPVDLKKTIPITLPEKLKPIEKNRSNAIVKSKEGPINNKVKDQYVYYDSSNMYIKIMYLNGDVKYLLINPLNGVSTEIGHLDVQWRNVKSPPPGPAEIPIEESFATGDDNILKETYKNGIVKYYRIGDHYEKIPISKEKALEIGKGWWTPDQIKIFCK